MLIITFKVFKIWEFIIDSFTIYKSLYKVVRLLLFRVGFEMTDNMLA